jgi:putative heme-binding domain-containing protein
MILEGEAMSRLVLLVCFATLRIAIGLVLTLTLFLPSICVAEQAVHEYERLPLSHEYFSEAANYGDFNRDGHRDIVSGPYWFEGPIFARRHQFYHAEAVPSPKKYADNFLCFAYDINGDGWDDVIVVDIPSEESPVNWYENMRGRGFWKKHLVVPNIDGESPTFADLTGDGRPELVGLRDGRLGYATWDAELPQRPWKWQPISEAHGWECYTHGLGIGDVNGDGKNDVLMADGWLEQPESGSDNGKWTWNPYSFSEGGAQMFVYDVDGDGLNDVITSHDAHAWGLDWFEQVQNVEGKIGFRKHSIMGSRPQNSPYGTCFSQLHALELADLDGDGLKDIVTGKCYYAHCGEDPGANEPAVLYYFRLVRDAGKARFVPHLIDSDSGVGRLFRAVDMDDDGLTDVITGNKKGIYLFRRLARETSDSQQERVPPEAALGQSNLEAAGGPGERVQLALASDERLDEAVEGTAESEKNEGSLSEFEAGRFFGSYEDRSRKATPADDLRMPEGFRAELLYTVPLEEQGSWVCLTTDPQGRLIASSQYGGMYRITLPKAGEKPETIKVEPLGVDIGCAQGLLWAFDSLYVVGYRLDADREEEPPSFFRVRDTNNDDRLDEVKLLRDYDGNDDEHGAHAVVLAPDGKSLYLIGGNVSFPDPPPNRSRVATPGGIDRLAGGIMVEKWLWQPNRVGGWVCNIDRDGKDCELIAMGMRNAYDMAFNAEGELFTFDSDMEWDAGTPWYRPTRVNHIISGADYGWRPTTSKWPDYFIDSYGSVVDVGFSSPTGVSFGYGARFPAKYQHSFFVGDWSLGYIYAVHLEPQGASYVGTVERFVSGAPLPVTDLVIRPEDGAMYFTVGGRGVTSALYRITYEGDESTKPAPVSEDLQAKSLRETRKSLEAMHHEIGPSAVEQAWPYLSNKDRAIRHAARIAIEHQPVGMWQEKALRETDPRTLIAAMVALARCGDDSVQSDVVKSLGRIQWASINKDDATDLARAYVLTMSRMGQVSDATRQQLFQDLLPHFPHGEPRVDQQLAELLCYLNAPDAIQRTLQLLKEAPTQEEQIHYAMCMCTLENGWSPELKRRFLEWFNKSQALRGGVDFEEYFGGIRQKFVDRLTPHERQTFADLLVQRPPTDPYADLASRSLVNDWTVAELLPKLTDGLHGHNLDNGRKVFATAMCYRCHRFDGRGGITGPDLTAVGRRFNSQDLLEAVIEPSRIISDQYRSVRIITKDGKNVVGKLTDQSGNILLVMKDALSPADITMVERDQVDEFIPSEVSLMPEGLLDSFTEREILDLFAFLLSQDGANDTSLQKNPDPAPK